MHFQSVSSDIQKKYSLSLFLKDKQKINKETHARTRHTQGELLPLSLLSLLFTDNLSEGRKEKDEKKKVNLTQLVIISSSSSWDRTNHLLIIYFCDQTNRWNFFLVNQGLLSSKRTNHLVIDYLPTFVKRLLLRKEISLPSRNSRNKFKVNESKSCLSLGPGKLTLQSDGISEATFGLLIARTDKQ